MGTVALQYWSVKENERDTSSFSRSMQNLIDLPFSRARAMAFERENWWENSSSVLIRKDQPVLSLSLSLEKEKEGEIWFPREGSPRSIKLLRFARSFFIGRGICWKVRFCEFMDNGCGRFPLARFEVHGQHGSSRLGRSKHPRGNMT